MAVNEPLIPLTDLKAPAIVVYGPDDEEMDLYDPRCEDIGIRTCCRCGKIKLLTEFYPSKPERCKPCVGDFMRGWRQRRRDEGTLWQVHRRKLLRKYALSLKDYEEMFKSQGGVCAICGRVCAQRGERLCVDHDHSCCPDLRESCGECVRGLLCMACNKGLGCFEDDPERLQAAIAYLLKYRVVSGVS